MFIASSMSGWSGCFSLTVWQTGVCLIYSVLTQGQGHTVRQGQSLWTPFCCIFLQCDTHGPKSVFIQKSLILDVTEYEKCTFGYQATSLSLSDFFLGTLAFLTLLACYHKPRYSSKIRNTFSAFFTRVNEDISVLERAVVWLPL